MSTLNTTQLRTQINRNVYGLLGMVTIIFVLILIVIEWQRNESERRDATANEYHLAISNKGLELLSAIDKTRLRSWSHYNERDKRTVAIDNESSLSPIRMTFSERDQSDLLKYEIEKLVKEISMIQTKFSAPEFMALTSILEQTHIKVQVGLEELESTNSHSQRKIDAIVAPLFSIAHQLQLLHKYAYQEIRLSKDVFQREKRLQIISLTVVLTVIGLLGVISMLRHVRHTLTALTKAQQVLHTQAKIIDQVHDAVVTTDLEGLITSWNKGAKRLFGYMSHEIVGKHIATLYPEEEHTFLRNEVIAPLQRKGTHEVDVRKQRKSGEKFYAHLSLSMFYDEHGNATGMIGYAMDITKRTLTEEGLANYRDHLKRLVRERTADLSAARDEAERANAAKSDFLSRMSHELRTPMNAILGFGQMLEMDAEGFNEIQRGNVQEILDAGHHLLRLINEVLDLTKIESGKLDISMQEVSIDDLLRQCITLIGNQAEARQIELVDHIIGRDYNVKADFTRLKQVLLNLLSNAVKYNRDHGRITLDSKIVDMQCLRIRVMDTGTGLRKEEIAKLFTPFERFNVVSNIEGTGIGLIITKRLVELMGGSIGVESTPGEGSTFWVELELTRASPRDAQELKPMDTINNEMNNGS